jgi:hypothetical protein
MSLRVRPECLHVSGTATAGTLAVVAAVGGQRAGIYRIVVGSVAGSAFTIQDTAATALSATYTLASNGLFILDTPINFDPWWQSGLGLGLQINAAATITADVWYLQTV